MAEEKGGRLCDRSFRSRAWTTLLAQLGIPYKRPCITRKTNLSHAKEAGANSADLAKAAGHSIETMNNFYIESVGNGPGLYDFFSTSK